jgi:hypothetical protein
MIKTAIMYSFNTKKSSKVAEKIKGTSAVSRDTFAAMAFGKRLKGILAICKPKVAKLCDISLPENPQVI